MLLPALASSMLVVCRVVGPVASTAVGVLLVPVGVLVVMMLLLLAHISQVHVLHRRQQFLLVLLPLLRNC